MAVRRVSNCGGNVIGKFPSLKMNCMVPFESLIERDFLYLLDYAPDVLRFEGQPLTIPYRFEGQVLTYTPDFLVVRAHSQTLVECKPADLVATEENQRKFRAAEDWCEPQGKNFQVVTDQQIRAGYRLENVRYLTYYARLTVRPDQRGRIYGLLADAQAALTVRDVARALTPEAPLMALPVLWHMAFHHEITVPLDEAQLSPVTPVVLARKDAQL